MAGFCGASETLSWPPLVRDVAEVERHCRTRGPGGEHVKASCSPLREGVLSAGDHGSAPALPEERDRREALTLCTILDHLALGRFLGSVGAGFVRVVRFASVRVSRLCDFVLSPVCCRS